MLEKQNFILTDGARERLIKLNNFLECGVPVLLEGPTGTSKTRSAEVVCKLLNIELIRFNLSSETKTVDLLGYYIGDPNSWAGISMQEGPFVKAFTEGKCLLLDELNLATKAVLQCIEEAIDSGVISIEIPGMPLKRLHMHENFRLVATQNPNKGLFSNKRQDLGIKFLSRFQVINFPELTKTELLKIAKGLVKGFGFSGDINIIKQLVDFHIEWSTSQHVIEDV